MKKIMAAMLAAAIITGGVIPANVSADEYEPYLCMGDTNGDKVIDGRDATDVLTFYAMSSVGNGFITQTQKMRIDVNCDSVVDGKDATDILSYYSFRSIGGVTQPDNYYMKNMLESGDKTALMKAAENLYDMACVSAISYQTNSRFTISAKKAMDEGGYTYYMVDDPRVKSIKDVYNDYHSIFATNIYFNDGTNGSPKGYISGASGAVYALMGGRGSNIAHKYSKITGIVSLTKDSITFNVLSHYDMQGIDNSGYSENKNDNFTLKIQPDGTLKVTEFTLPY